MGEAATHLLNCIRDSILPNEVQQPIVPICQIDGAFGGTGHDSIRSFSPESLSCLEGE